MERKLDTGFALAVLTPTCMFFRTGLREKGLWNEGYNPIQIKLSTTSDPHVGASGNSTSRTPLPLATEKSSPCNSPITHVCLSLRLLVYIVSCSEPELTVVVDSVNIC